MPPSSPPDADIAALILAGGSGSRLGLGPKCALQLGGLSLLERAVSIAGKQCGEIVAGVPCAMVPDWRRSLGDRADVIAAGVNRRDTLARLIAASRAHWLVVYDAARPFVAPTQIAAVLAAARATGAATSTVHGNEPSLLVRDGTVLPGYVEGIGQIATPQAFARAALERALGRVTADRPPDFPWVCQLVMESGTRLAGVRAPNWYFKVTTAYDWDVAQRLVGDPTYDALARTEP